MAKLKKSWREKLQDRPSFPKVLRLEKGFPCYNAVHKMGAEVGDEIVLVNPSEVVAIMEKVPKGKLITIVEICKQIAKNHGVKGCCSLTTGIFIMTAANAVEEASQEGGSLDIPYWRTLKVGGVLNEKYPGGVAAQAKRLREEGHIIEPDKSGKPKRVKDFEKALVEG